MTNLRTLFKNVGLPEPAARVYGEVLELKKVTARQISQNLDMPRPSVYDHLRLLIKEGLVVEFESQNKKFFKADSPENLERLIKNKMDVLAIERKHAREIIARVGKDHGGPEPRIKFFSGKDGYRQVLSDILLFPQATVCAMWPYEEMTRVAGEEYLKLFTKRRVAEGIKMKAVWPYGTKSAKSILLEETRIAPKGLKWQMGYAVYGDRVAFISSRDESFGFTVQSQDFSELMRAQFDVVWSLSKRL